MDISSDKKKELQAQYKEMRTEMGLFAVINKDENKYFLVETNNLKGKINSISFQLRSGAHPNKALLSDWQRLGADCFDISILEKLEHQEDKDDYRDELELLKMIWMERLAEQNISLY